MGGSHRDVPVAREPNRVGDRVAVDRSVLPLVRWSAAALAVLSVLSLPGCGSNGSGGSDPFNGAPHITDHEAESIHPGMTDADVAHQLGGKPDFRVGAADPASRDPSAVLTCWDYPVKGTEHVGKVSPGSSFQQTLASQWRFCFRGNQLAFSQRMNASG